MDLEKQKLVLSCLAGSRDLLALCNGIIKPSYFDPSLKKTVRFLQDYFIEYKAIPKLEVIRAECGLILDNVGTVEKSDINFISHEVENFCRNRAVTEAIIAGPELLQKEDFGQIIEAMKAAISVGLQKDMGLNYFENPESRLREALENNTCISTGYPELDDLIGGGVSRQEMLLFAANSGGGKSMNMLNIAKNLLSQGLHGVYISLEMAEKTVSKRLDSMITRIAQDCLLKEISKTASIITQASEKMGTFIIKRMPENRTNVNTIRSYLQQLEQATGFKPDFIVVDYLDIMGTTTKISLDNLFIKDKYVTEEVRSLGFDFNAIIISASQLGRQAIEADKLSQAHIQGGISKINTSDYTIGIKQDDLMKAAGELYYDCLKSRNSGNVGKRALMGWDPVSLNVFSLQAKAARLELKKKTHSTILGTDDTVFSGKREDSSSKQQGVLGLMNI
jgi:KaiC/GvpD/RAD55 family RecA-like ATPase